MTQPGRYLADSGEVNDSIDILIPAAEQRRRWGNISRATETRLISRDPAWPRPISGPGGRRYYSDKASREHLARVIGGEQS
jgi:hypothetical protein